MVDRYNVAKFRLGNQAELDDYAKTHFEDYQGIISVCGVV